jgi:hypothetical protein
MRREYDFSKGTRGKHVESRLRIIGGQRVRSGSNGANASGTGNTLIGTAGEYYVCAELCRLGYLALLTPKNNPLFDVVVTNVNGTRSASIQVKTRSIRNTQGWKIGKPRDADETPGDPFIVLVNMHADRSPDFYVYRYSEFVSRVSEIFENYITKPKRSGAPRKDPGFRCFDEKNFTDADRARMNDWQPIIRALEADS